MKSVTDSLKQSPLTHLWYIPACFSILSLLSVPIILELLSTCVSKTHKTIVNDIFPLRFDKVHHGLQINVLEIFQFVCLKTYLSFLSLAAML